MVYNNVSSHHDLNKLSMCLHNEWDYSQHNE